jgi:hypothetical protein
VHRIATSAAPLHVRISHLHVLGLDPALAGAVDEILLARAADEPGGSGVERRD